MRGPKERLFECVDQIAASPRPGRQSFLLAFAERSFFPVPTDVRLVTFGGASPESEG